MEIYINKEPVAFQLEKETSLDSIINYMHDWANQQNLYVLDYKVFPEIPTLKSVNQIKTIHITVGKQEDLVFENLQNLSDYLDNIGSFIASKITAHNLLTEEERKQLNEGYEWIKDSVDGLSKFFSSSELIADTMLSSLDAEGQLLDQIELLANLKNAVMNMMRQVQFAGLSEKEIENMIDDFVEAIPQVTVKLEEIATGFTLGKEAEALSSLEETVQYIMEGITVLRKKNVNFNSDKMVSILNDLTRSLDESDFVTAADIVDFDLKEELYKLTA